MTHVKRDVASDLQDPTEADIDRYIGARVRTRRLLLGLSQEALAELIGGVSYQQVQKYESGLNRISVSRLCTIADAFGTPVTTLLGDLAADEAKNAAEELLQRASSRELLTSFFKIEDNSIRANILRLVQTLGSSQHK